jgi:hypothetical protein
MKILGIDIGIAHLGLILVETTPEYEIKEVCWMNLLNITEYTHNHGPKEDECKLPHTKTICDWLHHVFQEYRDAFDASDCILIEKQPPTGLVAVEQLIFSEFRSKAELVHPRSVHKYFQIGHLEYDQRKERSIQIALKHMTKESLIQQFNTFSRQHDIADGICIVLFWLSQERKQYMKQQRKNEIEKHFQNTRHLSLNEFFDQYKYRST